jgi:murein DD-endopeptidase MepM/ murein hydrolase activator NlpD
MIHPPIKGFVPENYPRGNVTQWFGENVKLYSPWGLKGHNGIDIVAPHKTPILCVQKGTVVSVKYDPSGFGKHVRVMCLEEGVIWTYAHLANIHVTVGEEVEAGDKLGLMGNTGFVVSGDTPFWEHNPYAGTHLHLGKREFVVDEESGWRYSHAMPNIQILNYNNGTKGAIDFRHEFSEEKPKEITELQLTVISLANQVISLMKQIISNRNKL